MSSRYFLNKDDFCESCLVKTTFSDQLDDILRAYFWGQGKDSCHHNEIKIDPFRGNSVQAYLDKVYIDRDWPKFRYNWLGLFIYWIGHNCPVPSSPLHTPGSLAHWPNGMEQFPPFHWRQIHNGCSTNSSSFPSLFTVFLSMILLVIHVVTALQHSYYLRTQNPSKYGSQLCICITCCSANSLLIFQLYFNIINMAQIKYIHSLYNGSNSLRVHNQLMWDYLNSSEPNSSEHSKSGSTPLHLVYWL